VFVSSHVLSELEQVCDWLVMIDHGRMVFQGPAGELVGRHVTGLAVASESAADLPRLRGLLTAHGYHVDPGDGGDLVVRVGTDDPAGLAAAVNRTAFGAGVVLAELRPLRSSLEARYLSMVTGGDR
jgi:ABC-2 type transport system ATP-binding protein